MKATRRFPLRASVTTRTLFARRRLFDVNANSVERRDAKLLNHRGHRGTQGKARATLKFFIARGALVPRPLRVVFGLYDLPIAHVDDSVSVLRGFGIVRDHQNRLP